MPEQSRRRIFGLISRAIQWTRVLFYRAISTNTITGSPIRFQPVHCVGLGRVSIGENVKIGFFPSPLFFSSYAYVEARNASASISIGDETWINNNFCAIAEHSSILIGRNCRIGANVEILDSDFHGIKVGERGLSRAEWGRAVEIGNDVFIGSNVKILKGVIIGEGSVIANGSVVTKSVPAGVIAGGNPARVIRAIL